MREGRVCARGMGCFELSGHGRQWLACLGHGSHPRRGAELRQLVELALQAYRVEQPDVIAIEGEPVALTARQGLGLSLILHELATNAVKYGALSDQEGRVHLSWQLEDSNPGRRVRLLWQEHGGPPIEPRDKKDFGTRLIERACPYELEGEVELEYAPGGLRCDMVFPVT